MTENEVNLTPEKQKMESNITSYSNVLQSMTQRMELYKEQIRYLQEENKKVHSYLEELKEDRIKKRNEKEAIDAITIIALRETARKACDEASVLRILDEERNMQLIQLEEQVLESNTYKSKYVMKKEELNQKKENYNIASEEKRQLELSILDKNHLLSKANEKLDLLKEKKDHLNKEIKSINDDITQENEDFMNEKIELENHLSSLETEISMDIENEYKSYFEKQKEGLKAQLELEIKSLEESTNEYRIYNEYLEEENKKLNKENEEQSNELESLTSRNTILKTQNCAIKRHSIKEKEDLLNEIKKLKERQASLEQESIAIKQETDVLDKEMNVAISFLKDKDDLLSDIYNTPGKIHMLSYKNKSQSKSSKRKMSNNMNNDEIIKKKLKKNNSNIRFTSGNKDNIIIENLTNDTVCLKDWKIENKNDSSLSIILDESITILPNKKLIILNMDKNIQKDLPKTGEDVLYFVQSYSFNKNDLIVLKNDNNEIQDEFVFGDLESKENIL